MQLLSKLSKTDATTVNNSCFLSFSRSLTSSSSSSITVPRCTEHVRQSAFLPVTLPNVGWYQNSFISRLNSEFAVSCHWKCHKNLKCLATVPCDFSLITISVSNCHLFSDVNISQGSASTHLRCGGIFNYHFTANLLLNQPVKEFWKSFNGVIAMSLVVNSFGT